MFCSWNLWYSLKYQWLYVYLSIYYFFVYWLDETHRLSYGAVVSLSSLKQIPVSPSISLCLLRSVYGVCACVSGKACVTEKYDIPSRGIPRWLLNLFSVAASFTETLLCVCVCFFVCIFTFSRRVYLTSLSTFKLPCISVVYCHSGTIYMTCSFLQKVKRCLCECALSINSIFLCPPSVLDFYWPVFHVVFILPKPLVMKSLPHLHCAKHTLIVCER